MSRATIVPLARNARVCAGASCTCSNMGPSPPTFAAIPRFLQAHHNRLMRAVGMKIPRGLRPAQSPRAGREIGRSGLGALAEALEVDRAAAVGALADLADPVMRFDREQHAAAV